MDLDVIQHLWVKGNCVCHVHSIFITAKPCLKVKIIGGRGGGGGGGGGEEEDISYPDHNVA